MRHAEPRKNFGEARVKHRPKSRLRPSYRTEDSHGDAHVHQEVAMAHNVVGVMICRYCFPSLT